MKNLLKKCDECNGHGWYLGESYANIKCNDCNGVGLVLHAEDVLKALWNLPITELPACCGTEDIVHDRITQ